MRFALIWAQMYRNHANIPFAFFEDPFFVGDSLQKLGFELDGMDEWFERNFPDANLSHENVDEWKKVFAKIDLQTLGNKIFAEWRYFQHWACGPMSEADFQWFVMAFSRMAELAETAKRGQPGCLNMGSIN